MAISVLVIGESGTGKSTSIRNLNPAETYIMASVEKPLPFKNKYKKTYVNDKGEKIVGNLFVDDNHLRIRQGFDYINKERPEIKSIVIDDFQYVMSNEFMRKASEKGYDKFTELGKNTWQLINNTQNLRDDLTLFFLTHSEEVNGRFKAKTVGKMVDAYMTLEGWFTIVLHSMVFEGKYKFLTQNDGVHIAKSPMGMFDTKFIDNDLNYVKMQIDSYYSSNSDTTQ